MFISKGIGLLATQSLESEPKNEQGKSDQQEEETHTCAAVALVSHISPRGSERGQGYLAKLKMGLSKRLAWVLGLRRESYMRFEPSIPFHRGVLRSFSLGKTCKTYKLCSFFLPPISG